MANIFPKFELDFDFIDRFIVEDAEALASSVFVCTETNRVILAQLEGDSHPSSWVFVACGSPLDEEVMEDLLDDEDYFESLEEYLANG